MEKGLLMACHDCDLLHRIPALSEGVTATCRRCGALLVKPKRNSIDRTLSLAVTGMMLLVLANSFPFLGFEIQGHVRHTLLLTGIQQFYRSGMTWLALLVLFTTVIAPLVQLSALIYVLIPVKYNRCAPGMFRVFRWMLQIQPWSMMEVFMLGILISIVKLAKMAQIIPDVAVYCFMALIFVLAACLASLDPHLVWEQWNRNGCPAPR